ncbi:hypothetical protein [Streptomyces sp. CA2R101]|uniref:hypothetical protein n=1 Tax=Streptomyces sp. CA2R101 TaxID=3120152 RepID=UPI003008C3AE
MLYRLYIEAGAPPVARIAGLIADDDLPGMPSKDSVHRIIGGSDVPPSQPDTVSVAAVLARESGWNPEEAMTRIRALWVAAQLSAPVGEVVEGLDPFALGVSRPVSVVQNAGPLPELPPFVERDQDRWLNEFRHFANNERSAMVTLVGGSASGKTRSLQEFLLRLPSGWRLWHPYDPTRAQAALEHMDQVGPRTVIWLDDAHHYLYDPDAQTAERITAQIRTLLRDPRRGPVLVLATLWPHIWESLTAVPQPGQPDRYAQQRELLSTIGYHHFVPKAFLAEEIDEAAGSGDPRLVLAARKARGGELTQFLTGIPDLMARYRAAPPAAAGLIRVAETYRRLGHSTALPAAMLKEAALELLADHEVGALADDWAQEAFRYCTALCRGVPGLLVRVRNGIPEGQEVFKLNEYLEETGRFASDPVHEVFWKSAASHASSQDQLALAHAAERQGNLPQALLLTEAAAAAIPEARHLLARLRVQVGDLREAQRVYLEIYDSGDTTALPPLVGLALFVGDPDAYRMAAEAAKAGHANELVIMAMGYREANDPVAARLLAQAGMAEDPRGHCVLGLLELDAGNGDLANEHFRTAGQLGLPPMGITTADVDLLTRGGRPFGAVPIRWEEPDKRQRGHGS